MSPFSAPEAPDPSADEAEARGSSRHLFGWGRVLLLAAIAAVILWVGELYQEHLREEEERVRQLLLEARAAAVDTADRILSTGLEGAFEAAGSHAHAMNEARLAAQRSHRRARRVGVEAYARWDVHAQAENHIRVATLAHVWNLHVHEVLRLNPELSSDTMLRPGDEVLVYQLDLARRPRSRGQPFSGRLTWGMPMPEGDSWNVRHPRLSWGTAETVSLLAKGFGHVARRYPAVAPVLIGDISARYGRRLPPHRSHQSGRDVDATFYHRDNVEFEGFQRVSTRTLDLEKQWALFRFWLVRDAVEHIFVDRRLIRSLYRYAREAGESEYLLDLAFGPRGYGGLIRHEPGHRDHFHARFVRRYRPPAGIEDGVDTIGRLPDGLEARAAAEL